MGGRSGSRYATPWTQSIGMATRRSENGPSSGSIEASLCHALSSAVGVGSPPGQAQATAQTNFGNFQSVQSTSTSPVGFTAAATAIAQAGGLVSLSNAMFRFDLNCRYFVRLYEARKATRLRPPLPLCLAKLGGLLSETLLRSLGILGVKAELVDYERRE